MIDPKQFGYPHVIVGDFDVFLKHNIFETVLASKLGINDSKSWCCSSKLIVIDNPNIITLTLTTNS